MTLIPRPLDPDVVFRGDTGLRSDRTPLVGAENVARRVLARGARLAPHARPAIVNGNAGVIVISGAKPVAVVGFTIEGARIVEIDLVVSPQKLERVSVRGS